MSNKSVKASLVEVWRISWPLIIANSFWNLQTTIDRIFLGHHSTEALGAAIAAVGLFWAPMALVQQTAAYVTTFVAQYKGAKEDHWVGPSVWHSIYLSIAGGLLFLLLIPATPTLFDWIGHSPGIRTLEVEYFQMLAFSALPTALVAAASGFFTGLGRSQMVIWLNATGLVFNVLFDYLLIFGNFGFPEMGIAGAGLATALANFCAAFLGFYMMFAGATGARYQFRTSYKFRPELMGRFLKFGVPSGVQWALEGLAFTFFLVFIGRLPNGDAALAASGITVTIMLLALLPAVGVAQGVSALVGQYLGQDSPEMATQSAWAGLKISLVYIVVTGFSFVAFPGFYTNLFKSPDQQIIWNEVSQMVPYLLLFVAFFVCFDALNLIFSFTLKGAGDTRFVSLVALVLPWPLMVIPSWYVTDWADGVYWAWGAATLFICTQAIVFLWRFLQGKWKQMRVI